MQRTRTTLGSRERWALLLGGIKQTDFLAEIEAAAADDAAIADLESELKMKRDVRW